MRLIKIVLNLAKKIKKELLSSTKRATIFDIIRASFMVSRATFFDKKSYFFIVTPPVGAISVVRTWGCWRLEWLKLLLNVNGCCVVTRQDCVTDVISNITE